MRILSAVGFTISIIGLLLALYNQLALIPFLRDLNSDSSAYELSIHLSQKYEMQQYIISILCISIGAFSVLFCSLVYLKKRTRMTLIGTLVGFIVTIMGILHSL